MGVFFSVSVAYLALGAMCLIFFKSFEAITLSEKAYWANLKKWVKVTVRILVIVAWPIPVAILIAYTMLQCIVTVYKEIIE